MSTLDPSAVLFAGSAQTQATDLTLGLPLDALLAQLQVDDLLAAVVLPPQDGHDVLEILGEKIVAQLPATVRPGETLLLQVTDVNANQIIVRNLGALDAEQPLPPQVVQQTPTPATAQTPTPPQIQAPTPPPAAVAPPSSVFVAASVIRAPLTEQPQSAPPQSPPAQLLHTAIEARITAARAAAAAPIAQQASTASASPAPSALPPQLQRILPPHVSTQQPVAVPPRVLPAKAGTPQALLQAVRVPQSSLMLSAARVASDAVRRLPEVFARLESALQPVANDARTATLRTLVSFVTRLDPRNEEALPQQIASYVSNVLEGAEKKITTLIGAHLESAPRAPQDNAAPRVPQLFAEAKTVERSAAIEYDVKSLVLSLISRPTAQHTPELAQALRDAVVTLSGAQLHVLQQNPQTANAISFALPMFFHENGQPAHIRIQRDTGKGAQTLDGDNFHVAFVLDTSTLGTVAVELQSAGRAVTVNVRTQSERHVPAFKSTLADLVTRLEKLRYRVARTSAQAAPVAAPAPEGGRIARTTTATKPSGLDLHA